MEDATERTPLLYDDEDMVLENRKCRRPIGQNEYSNIIDCQQDSAHLSTDRTWNSRIRPREFRHDIVCVFVVAFDTRAGNIIEWCIPEDMDLDGIEFKAMASGSHRVSSDFIYFKKGGFYGISCFENMPVESEIERRARMKSVGLLTTSYTRLHQYLTFLECQVSMVLQKPGKYNALREFYEAYRGVLPPTTDINSIHISMENIPQELNDHTIVRPSGCFAHFVHFFEESIYVLWKFILLKKRIILFSPPPIGVVCYRVYCASCLGRHNVPGIPVISARPLFYVNVADIDTLETERHYVACTTEKIFESKPHLCDVYIDNQNLKADVPLYKEMLTPSKADKEKFIQLCALQRELRFFDPQPADNDEENVFTAFFTELNNQLFSTLLEVSCTQDKQLTSDVVKSMGLDPVGDRQFLMELVETYGIDVVLLVDNPCCPK